MTDLHARLLDLVAELRDHCEGCGPLPALHAVAQAVVALHVPHLATVTTCMEDGEDYPCPTIAAVAEALGVET